MRKIFLDIDGVLNTESKKDRKFHSFSPSGSIGFLDSKLKLLKKLLDETKAEIFLSSSWQEEIKKNTKDGEFLLREFNIFDIEIKGFTDPVFPKDFTEDFEELRGKTILKKVKKEDSFVVLDDRKFDMVDKTFEGHLVLIDSKKGLTVKDCEKVKDFFLKQEDTHTLG